MQNRRELLQTAGLAAFFLGLSRQPGYAAWARRFAPRSGADFGALGRSRPLLTIEDDPEVRYVDGFPFSPKWFGDPFPEDGCPFHHSEIEYPGGHPPEPDEDIDLAIVGGGLSGLALAYLLRDRNPVLFELHDRFGGVSKGEEWRGTPYSMGGAYFIQPDKGSWLESLYKELGLDEVQRFSGGGDDPVEMHGQVVEDFWSGAGLPAQERLAFERYRRLILKYTEEYPEIPLIDGRDNQWILDLDQRSLAEDITSRIGVPVPRLLRAGIEGYCYSSFDASWETISAAAGYNFLAAEEFGRWVCPGGNAWVTDVLWRRLARTYNTAGTLDRLRPRTRVVGVDVRNGRPLLTYKTPEGEFRTLRARRAALCCSKHVCKYMIKDLELNDLPKRLAMGQVFTNPYLVVNVLLDAPIALDFYDLFLLEDGMFPFTGADLVDDHRPIDVIAGHYAAGPNQPRSVLTLYWPRPTGDAVFDILPNTSFDAHAHKLIPHLQRVLDTLGVDRSRVRAVRMARWGHSMPVAVTGFLAQGVPAELRRPYRDTVFFANQDNWALPAFETCLLEAQYVAKQMVAGL